MGERRLENSYRIDGVNWNLYSSENCEKNLASQM